MTSLRWHRARRVPALVASLALFLLGTNFCVLSALSGDTRMACLTLPADATAAAVPACHGGAPAGDDHEGTPAAAPSCCPRPVVTPVAPALDPADDAPFFHPDATLAAATPVASPSSVTLHGHRPSPDGEPPTRLTRAPAPARAPPLA